MPNFRSSCRFTTKGRSSAGCWPSFSCACRRRKSWRWTTAARTTPGTTSSRSRESAASDFLVTSGRVPPSISACGLRRSRSWPSWTATDRTILPILPASSARCVTPVRMSYAGIAPIATTPGSAAWCRESAIASGARFCTMGRAIRAAPRRSSGASWSSSSCRFAACTATCRRSFATQACASRKSP